MTRFIKPISDYIFQTFLYEIFRGYESDLLRKELLYVDIWATFMAAGNETKEK